MNRSTLWKQEQQKESRRKTTDDERLTEKLQELIQRFPVWGYRRLWAWLRYREEGFPLVNKKRVYRILKENRWMVSQRKHTPRPRIQEKKSETKENNLRWAIDATTFWTHEDGVAHVLAIIDCYSRETIGWEISLRGRSKEAVECLEDACLNRFGLLFPSQGEQRPILRSDNGKIFCSKWFRKMCRRYGLEQEFITPYTPQQNGMIERFFRSLKEECIWLHNFRSLKEAKAIINEWIHFYNEERPHQALDYRNPVELAPQQLQKVA